ncbi:MAG: STAS domain-containing protein [Succinivibrionaceae bacterium]|nr:STAS domain-containing protein [Succinivibrionaceae bacterium]
MEINKSIEGSETLFKVSGRLDASNANEFTEQVAPAEGMATALIDFSDLEYISSAGLRCILKMAKDCKAQGVSFALFGLRPEVAQIFTISGFNLIVRICGSLDEARAASVPKG